MPPDTLPAALDLASNKMKLGRAFKSRTTKLAQDREDEDATLGWPVTDVKGRKHRKFCGVRERDRRQMPPRSRLHGERDP